MEAIAKYKELKVWQRGFDLVKAIYSLTASFPTHEQYGLTSQLRRAAVSVPVNIAEGYGRFSRKEYAHFISIAHGSAAEIDTLLMLAEALSYATKETIEPLLKENDELSRMMNALRQKLKETD